MTNLWNDIPSPLSYSVIKIESLGSALTQGCKYQELGVTGAILEAAYHFQVIASPDVIPINI